MPANKTHLPDSNYCIQNKNNQYDKRLDKRRSPVLAILEKGQHLRRERVRLWIEGIQILNNDSDMWNSCQ